MDKDYTDSQQYGYYTCSLVQMFKHYHFQVSENLQFRNYGVRFGEGDVIGCYLDLNTDQVTNNVIVIVIVILILTQAIMRFSVNGSDQGIAFRVSKSELAGRALFPHVLTKNQVSDHGDDLPSPRIHNVMKHKSVNPL